MSYNVITFPAFDRQAKRLSKKYNSLSIELADLASALKENPRQGAALGLDYYKIWLTISSKGKGKGKGKSQISV